MTRVVFCSILLLGIAVLSIASERYILSQCDEIATLLGEAAICEDFTEQVSLITEANEKWLKFHKNRLFILEKEHITDITTELERLSAEADTMCITDTFAAECETVRRLVLIFAGKQELSANNIL